MSKYIPGNQKHLTLNDRIYTENELAKGTSFKDIATFLCKDPTTISKEVRAHRISDWYHKGTFYNSKNFCIHRYHCKVCFFLFLLYGDRSKNNSSICSFDKSSLCRMAIISSQTEYSQYRTAIEKWKKETGKEPVAHGIRAKLAEKKQEMQNEQKNKQHTRSQNKDRGAR